MHIQQGGFAVNLLSPSCRQSDVQISSGVRPLAGAADDPAGPAAVVARDDWRKLSQAEADLVFTQQSRELGSAISVLDAGGELLEQARMRLFREVEGPEDDVQRQLDLLKLHIRVLELLTHRHGVVPRSVGAIDIILNRPGLLSTAFDARTGHFMGLHIDSHRHLPLGERSAGRTLCAINIGFAERYLDFINLPAACIAALLREHGVQVPPFATGLKDAFFREFPDYPVLRLTLTPGRAYLCDTRTTVHDCATNAHDMPDAALLTMNGLPDVAPARWEEPI
jgi:hypothetical protein